MGRAGWDSRVPISWPGMTPSRPTCSSRRAEETVSLKWTGETVIINIKRHAKPSTRKIDSMDGLSSLPPCWGRWTCERRSVLWGRWPRRLRVHGGDGLRIGIRQVFTIKFSIPAGIRNGGRSLWPMHRSPSHRQSSAEGRRFGTQARSGSATASGGACRRRDARGRALFNQVCLAGRTSRGRSCPSFPPYRSPSDLNPSERP